jgi:hypothetical protein
MDAEIVPVILSVPAVEAGARWWGCVPAPPKPPATVGRRAPRKTLSECVTVDPVWADDETALRVPDASSFVEAFGECGGGMTKQAPLFWPARDGEVGGELLTAKVGANPSKSMIMPSAAPSIPVATDAAEGVSSKATSTAT